VVGLQPHRSSHHHWAAHLQPGIWPGQSQSINHSDLLKNGLSNGQSVFFIGLVEK